MRVLESTPYLIPIKPVSPVAAYIGGKRNLAVRIIPVLAGLPHDTYVEPFVGMGGIFLRRPWRSRAEVIPVPACSACNSTCCWTG